jgi:hypothetical protein
VPPERAAGGRTEYDWAVKKLQFVGLLVAALAFAGAAFAAPQGMRVLPQSHLHVHRGGVAYLAVAAPPAAYCQVVVRDPRSPRSSGVVLPSQRSDWGLVSWWYQVDSHARLGKWSATIVCGHARLVAWLTVS